MTTLHLRHTSTTFLLVILFGTFAAQSATGQAVPVNPLSYSDEKKAPTQTLSPKKRNPLANHARTKDAVNQVMLETARLLKENNTLVIWLFDSSATLKKRREMVADGIIASHKMFGRMKKRAEPKLMSAIAAYGDKTKIITPKPVEDVTLAVDAIRKLPWDRTGKENVFAAVKTVTQKWLPYRTKLKYSVMVVIVTDERGDDGQHLEQVVVNLARHGVNVHCIGNAAPFGREKGYVVWEYDDGFKEELPVDQGPETVMAERLKLPFWGGKRDYRKYERLSAGFGPYALARLCAQTGGKYYLAEQAATQFDPKIMRDYQPDYRPIREYIKDVSSNQAKHVLIQACERSRRAKFHPPPLKFAGMNLNDPTALRAIITEAQKASALFRQNLTEQLTLLSQGETAREKIKEVRWRANYDLAMGRVLAMQVRSLEYDLQLAAMKSEPKSFQNNKSKVWKLQAAPKLNAGPAAKKLSERAKVYLTRVIKDHPATPWAMLAKRELSQPFGWKWVEGP